MILGGLRGERYMALPHRVHSGGDSHWVLDELANSDVLETAVRFCSQATTLVAGKCANLLPKQI